ncbi:hypothetical protein Tco_1078102 [Tanacetum coccineum]
MNTTQAQLKAVDDALVAPADRLEESICYHHQQVLKWQRNWNGQDSPVSCLNPLGFTKIIIDYFMSKDQSISRRNKMFWHTARDDTMFTSIRCISKHKDTQVYGTILPKELTDQARLESNAYKTYYAFASGKKAPKPKLKSKAKVAKPDKKKQPAKKKKTKGLTMLSEVALTEAEQLKLATKRIKTQFYSSYASGLGDGVDTQSKVPDEQRQKSSGTDEGTGTISGVPDVPIYESESEKESWGNGEDEDNEKDSDDISDEGDDANDGNDDDDDDATNDDKQEGDDTNDDDEETNSDITESDRIEIPILDQSTTEFYKEEEEENIDVEEMMYDDEDDEVTKELYEDVNVNLRNEDTDMTNVDQGALEQQNKTRGPTQSSSVSSYFTNKLLNLDNPSPVDNKIASLMVTTAQHATAIPEIASKTTTSLPALPDFAYVFKFNERVFNLEKDVSEIKQDDQYAQALSSIPAIVDCYMDNKLGEAINKEEVNTQFPQILPQAVSDFANPVIEKNVTESVEVAVLTRSSSQLTATYEVAASLFEFSLQRY